MSTVIGRGFLATELQKRELPDAVYYFSGPSSNAVLKNLGPLQKDKYINEILAVTLYCALNNKKLVYASSSLADSKTEYGTFKAVAEGIIRLFNIDCICVRLPLIYGPGEAHKGAGASVVYKFTKDIQSGISPKLIGDGTQTRDCMYIDDAIDAIIRLVESGQTGVISIGTGIQTSFNDIVATINEVLGTNVKPEYIDTPTNYPLNNPVETVEYKISLKEGIKLICEK